MNEPTEWTGVYAMCPVRDTETATGKGSELRVLFTVQSRNKAPTLQQNGLFFVCCH